MKISIPVPLRSLDMNQQVNNVTKGNNTETDHYSSLKRISSDRNDKVNDQMKSIILSVEVLRHV